MKTLTSASGHPLSPLLGNPLAPPSLDGPMKPFTEAASATWQEGGTSSNGLFFEVELWRSDLLTSVFELDEKGVMLGGGLINPLSPPGMN